MQVNFIFEFWKCFETKLGGVWASEAGRSGVKPFEVVPPSYWGSREFFVQRKKEMKINKTHLLRMKRNSTIQHGSKNGFTQSDNTELQSIKMSTEKKTIITDTKIFL